MCKNLMIVGIKPDKQKELIAFMGAMAPKMTSYDRDGLGFAAMTEFGIWGERWFKPEEAFKYRREWTVDDNKIEHLGMYRGLVEQDEKYNYFVENDKVHNQPAMAVIMHSRAATTPRTLTNVHPFIDAGIALIHNGVIGNHEALKKKYSTCDSEVILQSYIEHDVAKDPDKIKDVAHDLGGSYACGVLTRNADGEPIMDIFRSSPSLWVMYIKELDAIVFTTISTMVVDVCKELKWKMGNILKVKDDKLLRLNARTGRFLSTHGFFSSHIGKRAPHKASDHYYDGRHGAWFGGHDDDDSDDGDGVRHPSGSVCNLPVVGPANRVDNVVGQGDPNNDEAPSLSAQEELELSRTGSQPEKKSSLTQSAMRKSPKVLELEQVKRLTVDSMTKTGPITVDTEDKRVLH